MLNRVISMLVILPVVGLVVWQGGHAFVIAIALITGFAVAEWRAMTSTEGKFIDADALMPAGIACMALYSYAFSPTCALLFGAGLFTMLLAVDFMVKPEKVLWTLGVPYIVCGGLLLLFLRDVHPRGLEIVVWMAVVVTAMDFGGYAFGKTFGGPKLWPKVSPNKTWTGLLGGVFLAVLTGAVFSRYTEGTNVFEVCVVSAVVAGLSQLIGDLGMSAVKRYFKTKDFSDIIPGHGGILDRADGHLLAFWVVGLMTIARGTPLYIW